MGKITFVLTICILVLLAGAANFAQAQPQAPGPEFYLGEAHVDGGQDHDNVKVTGIDGAFRAIQIRVQENGIRFERVIIHYGDGQSEPIQIRAMIPAGGQTRVIDLPGGPRIIQRVEFYYARARWHGPKPRVRVFGFR